MLLAIVTTCCVVFGVLVTVDVDVDVDMDCVWCLVSPVGCEPRAHVARSLLERRPDGMHLVCAEGEECGCMEVLGHVNHQQGCNLLPFTVVFDRQSLFFFSL